MCLIGLFRAERVLTSRSSGLGSTSIRSVLENFFTIQPSNHPTIQPSNKRYTLSARQSPKILKPTKYFKCNSFVKLKMIWICWIFFAGISPKKIEMSQNFFGVPPKTYPPKNGNFTFFWSTPRKFWTKIYFFLSTTNFFFLINFPQKIETFSWVPPNFL